MDTIDPSTQQAIRLRVAEIFLSLQGESTSSGVPTVFIRLTGCPLRCVYCDTAYAFSGGQWMRGAQILEQVAHYAVDYVTVTGGEPMAQKACPGLLKDLADAGYRVSLETSGAIGLGEVDRRVRKIMDIKTPGSGESHRPWQGNLQHLRSEDEIKFVIRDQSDYEWSKQLLRDRQLQKICTVLFSPVAGQLAPVQLAEWILRDRLPVRFQIQLHKVLWGNEPGR